MMKIILGVIIALISMLGTPAFAAPTPPDHVRMTIVQVGHLIGDEAPLISGGQSINVKITGCNVSWQDNQQFYILLAANASPIILRKDVFDYAWEQAGHDWNVAFQAAVAAKMVCIVGKAQ